MGKITTDECYRLAYGFFYKIFPETINDLGWSINGCNYMDTDIFQFMKEKRELEDWEIEDIVTYMSSRIYYGIFKFCGCGMPEEMKCMIRRVLNCFPTTRKESKYDGFNYEMTHIDVDQFKKEFGIDLRGDYNAQPHYFAYMWILYHMEDARINMTEHGCSIYGSWLTEQGAYIKDILNAWYEYYKEDAKNGDQAG